MARVLEAFVEPERACVYLAGARAKQDVRVMIDVTPEEYEDLLVRGYRRFGPVYFRPACEGCCECVSIRIPDPRVRSFQGAAPRREGVPESSRAPAALRESAATAT